MSANDKLTEVLNDLIKINNDRVQGYDKAAEDIKSYDVDLQPIFSKMANDSRKYVAELTNEVERLGGEPATGTTSSGKIHRTWMDVKATFGGADRKGVLASCEFGEDAAQRAYKDALQEEDLSPDVRATIESQKATLLQAHNKIKMMRDAVVAHH